MCIFCKIISNEIPSYKVYEDDKFLAFLDISQTTKGHTLVVPKAHYEDILEMPDDLLQEALVLTKKLCNQIQFATNCLGFNILNNCKEAAGQTVKHFHIHIIPRYENDTFNISFSSSNLTKEEFISLQNSIKK